MKFLSLSIVFISLSLTAYAKSPDSWEKIYGSRLLAMSPYDAFGIGYDLPAELISNFSKKIIDKQWQNFLRAAPGNSRENREYLRDWLFLYEQNTTATDAWQELVSCFGGPENNNFELARQSYLNVNDEQCTSTKLKIAKLHVVIGQFLKSSLVTDPRQLLYSFFTSMTRRKDTVFLRMPVLHPLFLQILMEESLGIIRFQKIDSNYRNPDLFALALKYAVGQADDYEIKSFKLNEIPSEQIQEARATMNALYLLESVLGSQCTEWGLWPMISRGVVYGFSQAYIKYSLDLYWGYTNPITRLQARYDDSCGVEEPFAYEQRNQVIKVREKNFLYGSESSSFIKRFRELSENYKDLFLSQQRRK